MSYQITLNIAEDSELGRIIDDVAAREQLSREEAAFKLSQSNGADHPSPPTAREKQRAAVEKFIGSLKEENVHEGDFWWHHFNEEHYADIERENQRDLV